MSRHMQQLTCRFHPDAVLIEDYQAGDMICPMCGLVVAERVIDVSSEWRTFQNDTNSVDMCRVGAAQNPLFDNDNLQTTISVSTGPKGLDESGKPRYSNKLSQISSADKALRTGYDTIRVMAGRDNLSKRIINQAFLIFKHCYEKKSLRGRSHEAIVATCIYTACRKEGSARTMKEICDISTISVKEIGRCYNKLKRSLPDSMPTQSVEMKNIIPRFCNQLALRQEMVVRKTAIHVAERAMEICNIQGRAPSSVASAAIYMTCLAASEKKTKKEIQAPTGVSEGVIKEIYKIMLPHASQLFPADFVLQFSLAQLSVS